MSEWKATLDDGRVVTLESDHQPTEEEVQDAVAEYKPPKEEAKPEPEHPSLWHQIATTGEKAAGSVWEFLKGGMPRTEEEYAGMAVATPFTKEGNIPGLQAAAGVLSQLPPAKTTVGRLAESGLKAGVGLAEGATSRSMLPLALIPGAGIGGTLTKAAFGAWMVEQGLEVPGKIADILDRPGPMTEADKQEISDTLFSGGLGAVMGAKLLREPLTSSVNRLRQADAPATAAVVKGAALQGRPAGTVPSAFEQRIRIPEAKPKAEKPIVPTTAPEPERARTAVQEIRERGLDTKEKIRAAFPNLTREQAGQLRDQAFPAQPERGTAAGPVRTTEQAAAKVEIPNARLKEINDKLLSHILLTPEDRQDWVAAGQNPNLLPPPPTPLSEKAKQDIVKRVTYKIETGKRLSPTDKNDWERAGRDPAELPQPKTKKKGAPSASQIGQTTEVHGNVPAQPGEGIREVPKQTGGEGVRPQGAQEGQPSQQKVLGPSMVGKPTDAFPLNRVGDQFVDAKGRPLGPGHIILSDVPITGEQPPVEKPAKPAKTVKSKTPQPATGESSPRAVPEQAASQGSGKTGAATTAPAPPPITQPNVRSPFPQDADFTVTEKQAKAVGLERRHSDFFKRGGKWFQISAQEAGKIYPVDDLEEIRLLQSALPNPHDFQPAFRQVEGEPLVGDKGSKHDDIINEAKKDPEWLLANINNLQEGRGFWYEPPGEKGRFVTRQEAAKMLEQKEALHSERLADLQAATHAAPVPPEIEGVAKRKKNLTSYERARNLFAMMKANNEAPSEFVTGTGKPTDEHKAMFAAYQAGKINNGRALQRWIEGYWKAQKAQENKPLQHIDKESGGRMTVRVSDHPVDPKLWQPRGPAGVGFQSQEAAQKFLDAQAKTTTAPAGNENLIISKGEDGNWRIFALRKGAPAPGSGELGLTIIPGLKQFIDDDVGPYWTRFTNLVKETAGGLNSLFNASNKSEEARITADAIRQGKALSEQKMYQLRKEFGRVLKKFNDIDPYRFLEFSHAMETPGVTLQDPFLNQMAGRMRQILDDYAAEVQNLPVPQGHPGFLQHLVENYFPHIWADKEAAASHYAKLMGKRPLKGPADFLKRRKINSNVEGVMAGLTPVTWNPIEMFLMKAQEYERFIFGQKIFEYLKSKGIAKFGREEVPMVDRDVYGNVTRRYAKIDDRIANVISLQPTTKADGTPGAPQRVLHGHWYAQEDAARVLNNYLSPGLANYAWYRALRWTGNNLNMAQLGFSGFHALFTMIDTGTSKTALGVYQIGRGKVLRGTGNVIRGLIGTPFAANQLEAYFKGNKLLKEYYQPGSQGGDWGRIMQSLIAGGGRVTMPQVFKNSAMEGFFKALGRFNVPGALIRTPMALLEMGSYPLMQHVVPRLKLGVFADMARFELEDMGPNVSPEEFRKRMGAIWDNVDNRLGEMTYDNLFWNKTMKDLAFATTRAVGWNLGTLRELGGGAYDANPISMINRLRKGEPFITRKMSYLTSLTWTVGLMGGLYMWLRSGKRPEELRDYYFPKTGETLPDGTDERVNFPSYLKDISSIERHPLVTIGHKLHPTLATIADMLQNKDFYGTQIINPNDKFVQQVGEEFKFLGEQAIPFSSRASARRVGGEKTFSEPWWEAHVGIMPMPSELARTPAENVIMQSAIRKMPQGGVTQAEQMRHELSKETEAMMQHPKDFAAAQKKLREDEKAGNLTPSQMRYRREKLAFERNQMNRGKTKGQSEFLWRFEHLDLDEAKEVWAAARPEEKKLYKQAFNKKLRKARQPQVK